MSFGNMMQSAISNSNGLSGRALPNVFLDVRAGKRTFRVLPDPKDPTIPLQGSIALSVWIPVSKDGNSVERRIFIDDAGRQVLPEELRENIKRRFFLNVYDKTRVVKLPDGSILYPNLSNQYFKRSGGVPTPVTDVRPEANNSIVVLEGSVSLRPGVGRSGLLNELDTLSKTLWAEDGVTLIPLPNVDIEMVTEGTGLATSRRVYPGINQEPLSSEVLSLPVYDLESFTKPFPPEMIEELLAKMDYTEVMVRYNRPIVPTFPTRPAEEPASAFEF